jgi:predicted MPP superfamily phosphohydrolase
MIGSLVLYGTFIEPQMITVTERTIDLPVTEPLTIAVVSDMHVGPFKGALFMRRLVRTINNTLPDIVLLVGDYIYNEDAILSDLDPLEDIRSSVGVFGVLGNHDQGQYANIFGKRYFTFNQGEDIADALESLGIRMLRNEHEVLSIGLDSIAIAGIDDLWTADADLDAALAEIPAASPVILLSHNPTVIKELSEKGVDLVVSGHTHGGQIRLPFIGPLITLPIGISQDYDQGIFAIDDGTTLAITRGAGETWARSRLFAWPEIMLLTVQ